MNTRAIQKIGLLGMATSLLLAHPAALADEALTFLHQFNGTQGREPYGSVLRGPDDWLYGTTVRGGVNNGGVLFKMRRDGGEYRVLHEFAPRSAPEGGRRPFNGLTFVGNQIYGVTVDGGEYSSGRDDGGVLYRIGLDGTGYEIVHHFGDGQDGKAPYTAPVLAGNALYGMTFGGGSGGLGTIYRLDLSTGQYKTLHHFSANSGAQPFGTLTPVGSWLYGMTSDHLVSERHGTLFRMRLDGSEYEVLHRFDGRNQGGYPYDSLLYDGRSKFYGTTLGYYTDNQDEGVIFSYDLESSQYTVLHDFGQRAGDGAKPNGGLVLAPDGKWLYGVAHGNQIWGGPEYGTLFKLTTAGTDFAVLYTFAGGELGDTPMRTPLLFNDILYGTTAFGGPSQTDRPGGYGTVWAYSIPEPATKYSGLVCALVCLLAILGPRRISYPTQPPRKAEDGFRARH